MHGEATDVHYRRNLYLHSVVERVPIDLGRNDYAHVHAARRKQAADDAARDDAGDGFHDQHLQAVEASSHFEAVGNDFDTLGGNSHG